MSDIIKAYATDSGFWLAVGNAFVVTLLCLPSRKR